MTSLQAGWGGEQAYSDVSFQKWQENAKKWAVKKA